MILTCNVLANFKSRKKVEEIIEAIFGEEECNLKTKTLHPTGNYKMPEFTRQNDLFEVLKLQFSSGSVITSLAMFQILTLLPLGPEC